MKKVTGKILDGEQRLVIIKRKGNPKLKKRDVINIGNRRFRIWKLEASGGNYTAEVAELIHDGSSNADRRRILKEMGVPNDEILSDEDWNRRQ
jgi:hypothetical protein